VRPCRHEHPQLLAPSCRPSDRTSRPALLAHDQHLSHAGYSEKKSRRVFRSLSECRPEDQTMDAMDTAVLETWFRGCCQALLYNEVRTHLAAEGREPRFGGLTAILRWTEGNRFPPKRLAKASASSALANQNATKSLSSRRRNTSAASPIEHRQRKYHLAVHGVAHLFGSEPNVMWTFALEITAVISPLRQAIAVLPSACWLAPRIGLLDRGGFVPAHLPRVPRRRSCTPST
jgi:hypothetical protein